MIESTGRKWRRIGGDGKEIHFQDTAKICS